MKKIEAECLIAKIFYLKTHGMYPEDFKDMDELEEIIIDALVNHNCDKPIFHRLVKHK